MPVRQENIVGDPKAEREELYGALTFWSIIWITITHWGFVSSLPKIMQSMFRGLSSLYKWMDRDTQHASSADVLCGTRMEKKVPLWSGAPELTWPISHLNHAPQSQRFIKLVGRSWAVLLSLWSVHSFLQFACVPRPERVQPKDLKAQRC